MLGKYLDMKEHKNSISFFHKKHQHFIEFKPNATHEGLEPYMLYRLGDPRWYIECKGEYVYSMSSLLNGTVKAPTGLKAMARQAYKYVKSLDLTDDQIIEILGGGHE